MKKTEKIEIRVTPKEKKGLVDLARSEDRSVSELIRSIIAAYMSETSDAAQQNQSRITQMAKSPKTWSAAAVLTCLTGSLALSPAALAERLYTVNVEIADHQEGSVLSSSQTSQQITAYSIKESDAFVDLLARPFASDTDALPLGDDNYEVRLKLEELEDGSAFASFQICVRNKEACDLIAEPSLQFYPKYGGRIEIDNELIDPETGQKTPFSHIAIDIAADEES